jgi:hypothetical protein
MIVEEYNFKSKFRFKKFLCIECGKPFCYVANRQFGRYLAATNVVMAGEGVTPMSGIAR